MEINEITKCLRPYLSEYKVIDNIITHLHYCGIEISKREFQKYVMLYNKQFDRNRMYLASTNEGYKFTSDKREIRRSLNQRLGKFVSGINNIKETYSILGDKNQISLLSTGTSSLQAVIDAKELSDSYEQIALDGLKCIL